MPPSEGAARPVEVPQFSKIEGFIAVPYARTPVSASVAGVVLHHKTFSPFFIVLRPHGGYTTWRAKIFDVAALNGHKLRQSTGLGGYSTSRAL